MILSSGILLLLSLYLHDAEAFNSYTSTHHFSSSSAAAKRRTRLFVSSSSSSQQQQQNGQQQKQMTKTKIDVSSFHDVHSSALMSSSLPLPHTIDLTSSTSNAAADYSHNHHSLMTDTSSSNEPTTTDQPQQQQQRQQQQQTEQLVERPQQQQSQQATLVDRLNQQELRLMRTIQQLPGLRPLSLAIHYSLMPQVVTPALAMIAWLVSLPAAASLICFVCAQDIINTAIKWAVNRPRPLWYAPGAETGLDAKYGASSWEADYSFPSAHTQFFTGLAFCSFTLSGACGGAMGTLGLGLASAFGMVIGITRNYLGVHWPTDTTFGLLLGAVLGTLWGKLDPYAWLLKSGSPALSLGVASAFAGSLTLLLVLVRRVVKPVDEDTLAQYCANVYSSLPEELRNDNESSLAYMPRPRHLRSKVSMLVTVWCTLAYTALCPTHLPTAIMEPMGQVGYRLTQATVGIGGLSGFGLVLKKIVMEKLRVPLRLSYGTKLYSRGLLRKFQQGDAGKTLFKGLAYAGICAWTFILSQLASHRLLSLLG